MTEDWQMILGELDRLRQEVGELRKLQGAPTPGKACARLGTEDGEAGLYLYDKDGRCRALLAIAEKGPRLELFGENGNAFATLRAIDGHGYFCTAAPDGVGRAS